MTLRRELFCILELIMTPSNYRPKKAVVNSGNINKILNSLNERGHSPTSVVIAPDGSVTLVLVGDTSSSNALEIELRKWEGHHG